MTVAAAFHPIASHTPPSARGTGAPALVSAPASTGLAASFAARLTSALTSALTMPGEPADMAPAALSKMPGDDAAEQTAHPSPSAPAPHAQSGAAAEQLSHAPASQVASQWNLSAPASREAAAMEAAPVQPDGVVAQTSFPAQRAQDNDGSERRTHAETADSKKNAPPAAQGAGVAQAGLGTPVAAEASVLVLAAAQTALASPRPIDPVSAAAQPARPISSEREATTAAGPSAPAEVVRTLPEAAARARAASSSGVAEVAAPQAKTADRILPAEAAASLSRKAVAVSALPAGDSGRGATVADGGPHAAEGDESAGPLDRAGQSIHAFSAGTAPAEAHPSWARPTGSASLPSKDEAAQGSVAPGGSAPVQPQHAPPADAIPLQERALPDAPDASSSRDVPNAGSAARSAEHAGANRPASTAAQEESSSKSLPGMHTLENHAPAFAEGASSPVQGMRAPAAAAGPAWAPADPFRALDGATAPTPTWTRAGAHNAEAGYLDPSLGWVGVRADAVGNAVHASIVPATADAAQMLSGHIAGLSAFMGEQQGVTATVSLSAPENPELGTGMNQGQSSGQDMTGHANAQQENRSDGTVWPGDAVRPRAAAVPLFAAGGGAQFTRPVGATISLVA